MEILPLTRSNIQRVTGDRPQSSNDYRQLSETTRSTDLSKEGDQRSLTRAKSSKVGLWMVPRSWHSQWMAWMDTSKYRCPRNLLLTKDLKAKDSNLTSVVNHSLCKIVSMLKGHCLYNWFKERVAGWSFCPAAGSLVAPMPLPDFDESCARCGQRGHSSKIDQRFRAHDRQLGCEHAHHRRSYSSYPGRMSTASDSSSRRTGPTTAPARGQSVSESHTWSRKWNVTDLWIWHWFPKNRCSVQEKSWFHNHTGCCRESELWFTIPLN